MSKPGESTDWATNDLYAGGPDLGTVTKVQPTAATEADGWRGEQYPPPQYQNYWQNAAGRLLDWLASMMIATLLQDPDSRSLTVSTPAFPASVTSDGSFYYATGASFSGGIVRSEDGIRNWRVPTTPAGVAVANEVAADGSGIVIGANDGGEIIRSADFGDTYVIAEAAAAITTDHLIAAYWDPAGPHFVVLSAVGEIFTSPAGLNGTWTSRSVPGGGVTIAGHFAIATSGAASGRAAIAAGTGVYYTDDGWVTSSLVLFTGGAPNDGVCCGWSDENGGHFLIGTANGEVWTSADATSWAMVASDVGPTVDGVTLDSFGEYLISDGGGIWAALILTTGAAAKRSYYYSLDAGLTWTRAPYDSPAQIFHSLYFSDGRFYLGHGDNSGQIYVTPTSP